jgi:putative ABC transport system substrate-binding protein
VRSIEAAASSLRVQPVVVAVRATADIEPAFESFARAPNGGLILTTDPFIYLRQQLVADLATRHRLPAISWDPVFPKHSGLMSYGANINLLDQFQQAAGYVDRILKGEKPGDLPVQAPTKYELVVNLKTAKALGLEIPATELARADEVIE